MNRQYLNKWIEGGSLQHWPFTALNQSGFFEMDISNIMFVYRLLCIENNKLHLVQCYFYCMIQLFKVCYFEKVLCYVSLNN